MAGRIRVGVGGWVFEPWRGAFYPEGLSQKRELEYASRQLTSIEINGTYYGSQKPESFRKWVEETPEDFVFAVKGPRFATNRRVLAEAGEFDRPLLQERGDGAGRQARPGQLAVHGEQEVRPGGLRGLPVAPAPGGRGPGRSGTPSRCGTRASATPEFVALAREHGVAVIVDGGRGLPADRRRDGALRLCAHPGDPRGRGGGLCGGRSRPMGRAGARLGGGRRRGGPRDGRAAGGAARRATSSSTSSAAPRRATRRRRWR